MRILLVAHNFLPAHSAGTEVYTGQLARELVRRGNAVRVLASEKDVGQRDLTLREREWEGVPVTEIVNNLHYDSFRATWDHPAIDALFAQVLERERPELVHFQHLMYLSIGCVEEAARRKIPIVFTLHDYWLQCPRFGQRLRADGALCERIEFARCGECLTSFKFRQTALERWSSQALAGLRSTTGVDLSSTAKRAARALGLASSTRAATDGAIDREAAAELEREMGERDRAMRERVVPHVFRFLAPSGFLRERFVEWGLPSERIHHLRTGVDPARFPKTMRAARAGAGPGKLRVAFVGTLAPHKGPQVLLAAWGKLPAELRERATLELFGPPMAERAFLDDLEKRAAEVGASMRGALPRERVASELAGIDLLVVPSVWWENSPMVILEALAVRTPVLVAAIGGMSELVADGRTGARFRAGDADDLARKLTELLGASEKLAALFAEDEPLKSVAQDALEIEGVYSEALRAPRAGSERS